MSSRGCFSLPVGPLRQDGPGRDETTPGVPAAAARQAAGDEEAGAGQATPGRDTRPATAATVGQDCPLRHGQGDGRGATGRRQDGGGREEAGDATGDRRQTATRSAQ